MVEVNQPVKSIEHVKETVSILEVNFPNKITQGKVEFEEKRIDEKAIKRLTGKFNEVLSILNTRLKFSVHEGTNTIVVQILDSESGEVLKEVPSTKFLELVSKLGEYVGFMIDEKA